MLIGALQVVRLMTGVMMVLKVMERPERLILGNLPMIMVKAMDCLALLS